MIFVVVGGAVIVLWLAVRRRRKVVLAGLTVERPQQVHIVDTDPTGPSYRWRGTAGDL